MISALWPKLFFHGSLEGRKKESENKIEGGAEHFFPRWVCACNVCIVYNNLSLMD